MHANYWLCESFIGNARTFPTWSSSLCHCLRVIYLSTWVLALNANNKIADFLVFLATIHKDFVLRKERYDFPQSSKTEKFWNRAPYLQEYYWYKSCGCLEKSLQIKLLTLLSPKKFGFYKSKSDRELHGVGVFCFGSCFFFFFFFFHFLSFRRVVSFSCYNFTFSVLSKLCRAPNMIAVFLQIVSLSVFAFKIKILNRNPWAGVLYCNRSDHSCWHSCDISCKKRFSVLLLLLPPNNLSRNGCHSKTSRQIARNIALCVTPAKTLAPWTSPLTFGLCNL